MHLHFYGDFTQGQWAEWIPRAQAVAGDKLHLHPNVDPRGWLREFSQYDAGWLHYFASDNAGDLRRANWDDLNYPARIATLAVAGLPLLQYDNADAIVAAQTLARAGDLGFFGRSMAELAAQLYDRDRLNAVRESVWRQRDRFTFDAHADDLIAFFRQVIAGTPVRKREGREGHGERKELKRGRNRNGGRARIASHLPNVFSPSRFPAFV